MLKLSFLMTMRDWRAGELRFLLAALALAVASLSAVQFFSDRMGSAMRRDAHGVLAADMLLASERQPLDPSWAVHAASLGLRSADTIELESMAIAGEGDAALSKLVSVKAVSAGYPLRGALKLQDGPWSRAAGGAPQSGTVWIDPELASSLGLAAGARLRLGEHALGVAGAIAAEPDRGPAALMFAPRVMLSIGDLRASGLLQAGSFVTYRLLLAGEPAQLAQFERWAKARLPAAGVRLETLATSNAESSEALAKGHRFLALVGLLSALLASLAVAMAARRFMLRHADACAMLRCLGMPHSRVLGMYLAEFLLVGLAGSALGVLIGFGAHFVLLEWLGALVSPDLEPASLMPALRGMAVGVLLLIGFALPPLLQLRDIPHNRLLRSDIGTPSAMTVASQVLGAGVFGLLLVWQAGDVRIGLLTVAAFGAGLAVFAAVAWGAVAALRLVPDALGRGVWRLALADLRRRPGAAVTQVVALSLGLMALLLLTVVRGDLLGAWRDSAPAGAPNHIAYNIQPDQREAVAARMHAYGKPVVYPVMRGRLSAVNGKQLSAASFDDKRAKGMLEQELAVAAARDLPAANSLVAGKWFGAAEGAAPELSVSDVSAGILKLKVGDRVTLDFAGQRLTATVTSLRKYDRRSRNVNFNFVLNAGAAQGLPATYVTALHVPAADTRFVDALVRDYPNLTVIDTGAIVAQLQRMLEQVCAAVEFLFVFTLASGVLVLYATLVSSQDARMRQAAVLRAMGASRAQLSRAQWLEYALTGSLAGLLAAAGATAGSWALARFAFQLEWHFSPLLLAAGLAAGSACAMLGGWAGLRAVLRQSPLLSLRSI